MKLKRHFSHYRQNSTRKRTLSENMRRTYYFLTIFGLALAIVSLGVSVWSNTQQSTQAYRLRELQEEHEQLQEDSRRLNHFMLEAQSLNKLELSSENSSMDTETDSESVYLNISDYAQVIP